MESKKAYPSPTQAIANLNKRIKPRWKVAFFASVIIGLLCHIFVITNDLPVPDTLNNYYATQNAADFGRWFLMIACLPGTFFNLPAVNSLLTLFYMALAAAVLVEFLDLKENLSIILLCAVLATFPTTAAMMGYMYTVDGYFLALLMTCLAVCLTKTYKRGFIAGIVLLTFALGTYQAYLTYAIMLVILHLLLMLLDKTPPKEIGRFTLRYLIMGVGGVALYLIVTRIIIAAGDVTLTQYQGAQALASFSFSLRNLVRGVVKSYTSFGGTFLANGTFGTVYAKIMLVLYLIVCGLLVLRDVVAGRLLRQPWRLLLMLLLVALIPIGLTIVGFADPEIHYHFLMKAAYMLLFVFAVVLSERLPAEKLSRRDALLKWGAVVTTAGLCFSFWLTTNIAYENMSKRYEKDYGLCLRVVDRVEQLEGYEPGMPLYVPDGDFPDVYPLENPSQAYLWNIVDTERNTMLKYTSRSYNDFMREFLNVAFSYPGEDMREQIRASAQFEEMGYWPAADSVAIIDGVAVVKMRQHENTAT